MTTTTDTPPAAVWHDDQFLFADGSTDRDPIPATDPVEFRRRLRAFHLARRERTAADMADLKDEATGPGWNGKLYGPRPASGPAAKKILRALIGIDEARISEIVAAQRAAGDPVQDR